MVWLVRVPDVSHQTEEIRPEDLFHACGPVPASDEQVGQLLEATRVIQLSYERNHVIPCFAWRRNAQGLTPPDFLAQLLAVLVRQLHGRDPAVSPDSDVVLSAHLQRMLNMLDDVSGSGGSDPWRLPHSLTVKRSVIHQQIVRSLPLIACILKPRE
jgi:hypothetical protein